MVSVKELKSIDLSSLTIVSTAIAVLFSIITCIIVAMAIGISTPNALGVLIYVIPTIIVGSFMLGIYENFTTGLIYNFLAKKFNTINIAIENDTIVKVSTTSTAIILSMITTIEVILFYLASVMLLPLMINATMQTLMFSGQQALAYSLYQLLVLISQPTTIAMIIFGTFIITFVFVLLGCYIYNLLATYGKGVSVKLSQENNLTVFESVDQLKLAIACAIIGGILNLILAIIIMISGGSLISGIGNIIGGFISGFVEGILIAIFYNFIAQKVEKLKLELIDI